MHKKEYSNNNNVHAERPKGIYQQGETMTNNELREKIKQKGITVENVKSSQLDKLFKILRKTLKKSDCFNGSYRIFSRKPSMFMECKSDYFEKRELVSFNRDGFIGFAGWSDSKNMKPIEESVLKWLESI